MGTQLELDYLKKFKGYIHPETYGYLECVYADVSKDFEDKIPEDADHPKDEVVYSLDHLTRDEIIKLMEESLKTGKNLLFEACKDKKVIITVEMQNKAIENGKMILW